MAAAELTELKSWRANTTGISPRVVDAPTPCNQSANAIRRAWGVGGDTKVILVVGRMLRRKGHHVVVKAVHRLKERGLKDFVCVFAGEDQGRTHYTGELWNLVSQTGTADCSVYGACPCSPPRRKLSAQLWQS